MKQKQRLFQWGGVVLTVLFIVGQFWLPLNADDDGDYEPNQVVVKLNLASGVTIEAIHNDYNTLTLDTLLGSAGIYLLQISAEQSVQEVVDLMRTDSRLLYAEPNFIGGIPEGDPSGTWAWGGYDPAPFLDQYAAVMLNLADAHTMVQGNGMVVAVVDTGIQPDHPQLAPRLAGVGYDFIDDDAVPNEEANGLEEDGDSLIDEGFGHGTHVAGIVSLVAPQAQLMPLRVLDSDGRGNDFILAEAIQFAVQNGSHVINLSLGTPTESELLKDVVSMATASGVVIVAAAGNQNSNLPQYPAAVTSALAVTAVDPTGSKASFANYGEWVDIAAPGQSITSTFPVNGFAQWSGTSMATAFISGQAALIRSQNPTMSAPVIATLIQGTAQPLDGLNPNYENQLGAGLANISRSLSEAPPTVLTNVTCGQVVMINVVLSHDLADCPGDGIVIGAAGITVDLNGRTVDGIGLGSGIRNDGYDGVTITNGVLQEFDYGVFLSGAANGTISSLTLQLNQDVGVWLDSAGSGLVQGNTVLNNSYGIILSGFTQNSVVENNLIVESDNTAVLLTGTSSNILRSNIITASGDGAIELADGANNNRIEANSLTEGGDAGIIIEHSSENELVDNLINQMSDSGIVLDNAHNNTIRNNNLRFNSGGLELSSATGNLIESNDTSYTTGIGIEVGDHALNNVIMLNTANFNNAKGILIEAEVENAAMQPGNWLDRNIVVGNQSDGIAVTKAGHTLTANVANNNQDWGIYAELGNSGSGNSASGNIKPEQCYNIVCTAVPPPPAPSPDNTPPETSLLSGPETGTLDTNATFAFSASETNATFLCRLDDADFAACSSPATYTALSPGEHSFQVQAVDAAGNIDPTPANFAWTILPLPVVDCGPPITLEATADAWIEQNSPNNNKGDDSILKVKAQKSQDNFRALVRFTLPTIPAGCVVETAVLKLYSPSWVNGRTLQAYRLAGNWNEMSVTWNNQPSIIGTAATTSSGSGYRQWSVTTQVQNMFIEGSYGFLIRDSSEKGSGYEQQFHAREKEEYPPQLVITLATGD